MKFATALKEPLTSRNTVAQLEMIMATTRYLTAVTARACTSPPRNAAWYSPIKNPTSRMANAKFVTVGMMAVPSIPVIAILRRFWKSEHGY